MLGPRSSADRALSTMSSASSNNVPSRNRMDDYAPPPGYFDEYLDAKGRPRAHWEKIAGLLGRIDDDSWTRRQRQLERLIHDNGITYNVYGDETADHRPWSMDMVPLVLTAAEIAKLEGALSQRAHLLNLALGDVYGRQTLLQSSRMHPYLIYGNPAFLRPCHGLLPPKAKHIQIYAADIARAPDGNWWVLGDRVEAASGLGYALENRMLMSRLFPKVMLEAETASLQPFINDFTNLIESLAPRAGHSPNVALLTPGPSNETYFEQSFLARNLGYTLAEGADLTVRNNFLYMKTIGGVQRVDVLLRRVDSSWVDPLELRNESLIGVPGLLNAARLGNVCIANALGSGFVETTAMLAFLPWFSRNYLGEELEIPSVATWWCGQERERRYVLENLDTLVVKPTFWGIDRTYFGPQLSAAEKEELVRRINHRPERYCGQEIVSNATIPIFRDGRLQSRHFQLRVFLIRSGNNWRMMPGGLLRYAQEAKDVVVSMQRGGASKDVWILRDPAKSKSKRPADARPPAITIRRAHNDLPSRTGDNLFWLGRYVERAEGLARALRCLCRMMIDEIGHDSQLAAIPLLEQIVPHGADMDAFHDPATQSLRLDVADKAIAHALYDTTNVESLVSNFFAIERAASKVKERLSADTWRRLRGLRELVPQGERAYSIFEDDPLGILDQSLQALASFVGNLMENTTRSQGWRFLEIGRRIERGISLANLLRSAYAKGANNDESLIAKLLEWGDSSITYRRRYLNTLRDANALDVLCFDATNPRALAFQTEQLRELLAALPHAHHNERHPIDQAALRLYSRVGLADPQQMLASKRGRARELESFFAETCSDLFALSQSIEQTYFAHTTAAREQQHKMNLG